MCKVKSFQDILVMFIIDQVYIIILKQNYK